MSNGEAAQMAIAADLLGVDYDTFLEMLAREAQERRPGEHA